MDGGQLIREARRRAGLTQRQLADRLGTTQSVVARLERGGGSPTCRTLTQALRECGFDLEVRLVPHDEGHDHDWGLYLDALRRSPEGRLRDVEAAAEFSRRTQAAGADGPGRA